LPEESAVVLDELAPVSAMVAPLPAKPTEPVMLNVGTVAVALKPTFTGPLVASLVTVIVADRDPAAVAKT